MGALRNWKHERFAQEIERGTNPEDAYVLAGFARCRRNYVRLLRKPHVAARLAEIKLEREVAARVARMPLADVVDALARCGVERIGDLFEATDGGLVVRDLRAVPVEVALAFTAALRDGFGLAVAAPSDRAGL